MRLRFSDGFIFTCAFTCSSILWAGAAYNYVVKNGDTLSEIAQRHFHGAVYTARGSIAKLRKLNPEIKNENLIFPGQQIVLEESVAERKVSSEEIAPLAPHLPVMPAPIPVVQDETEFAPSSQIGVDSGFNFFRIDSTDKTNSSHAKLLSNLNPVVRLSWELDLTERFAFGISLNDEHCSVQQTLGGPAIANPEQNAYGVEVQAKRKWSRRSSTAVQVGYQEKIFNHAPAQNQVQIDLIGVPYLAISHKQDLFSLSKASFGMGAEIDGYGHSSGAGYSTDQGYGGKAFLYANHELKNVSIHAKLLYNAEKINSELTTQTRSDLGLSLGLVWRFEE